MKLVKTEFVTFVELPKSIAIQTQNPNKSANTQTLSFASKDN